MAELSKDQLHFLHDRVKYINDIRLRMFSFYLLVIGALYGFSIQKLDFEGCAILTNTGFIIIGTVALGVFCIGSCLFTFDLWALGKLYSTVASLGEDGKEEVSRLFYGLDEDFWIATPMMIINSTTLAISISMLVHEKLSSSIIYLISISVGCVVFIAHIFCNLKIPQQLSIKMKISPYSIENITIRKK